MMRFASILLLFCLSSCFLFNKLKKDSVSFSGEPAKTVVIPKGRYKKTFETDSAGNEANLFKYGDGTVLYFARMKDTSFPLQPIDYQNNVPKVIYQSVFFKGLDSTLQYYWRESRNEPYRFGYRNALAGEEWLFDSSLNYFSRHMKP